MIKLSRIQISVLCCAYEIFHTSLIPDTEYDQLALKLDHTSSTDRPDLDQFFATEYTPHTGLWIYKHPELDRLKALVMNLLARRDAAVAGYSIYNKPSRASKRKTSTKK